MNRWSHASYLTCVHGVSIENGHGADCAVAVGAPPLGRCAHSSTLHRKHEKSTLIHLRFTNNCGLCRQQQTELGLEVIYGDTDSVMVNTRTKDLAQAKQQVRCSAHTRVAVSTLDSGSVACPLLSKPPPLRAGAESHSSQRAPCACSDVASLLHARNGRVPLRGSSYTHRSHRSSCACRDCPVCCMSHAYGALSIQLYITTDQFMPKLPLKYDLALA